MPQLAELALARRLEPFSFSSSVQAGDGTYAQGVCQRGCARSACARRCLTSGSVTAAMYDAGFNSNARFYAQSDAALGMMPSAYRTGGNGEQIRFAIAQCSLGAILVAATERGVCAITLGDEPEALLQDLQHRFPRAQLSGGDAASSARSPP